MAVTYGFYNSFNGDRKYDAIQMSSIFDGIIRDGVFIYVTGQMKVTADGDSMMVKVAPGRAWFNHTWTLNDAILPITIPQSEVILNRIDAVVIDVNSETRTNNILVVRGTPATNPANPTLLKGPDHWQYPLAYVRVNAQVTKITQANITNKVGTSDTPWVTAPLEMVSIDDLFDTWRKQWEEFYAKETKDMSDTRDFWKIEWERWYTARAQEFNDAFLAWKTEYDDWFRFQKEDMTATNEYWKTTWEEWFNSYLAKGTTSIESFLEANQKKFDDWFNGIKDILDGEVEGKVANILESYEKRLQILEQFKEDLTNEYTIWTVLEGNGELGYVSIQDENGMLIRDEENDPIMGEDFTAIELETQDNKPIEIRTIFCTKPCV